MKDNQTKYPQLRFKGFTDPWEERKLGDTETHFTDGNYGESYPSEKDMSDKANGIPFLRGSDFSNGYLDSSNANYIKPEKHAELTSGHIKQDDIVLAVRGSLGTLGYATKENEGWNINSQLAILRTNKSEISGMFLIQYLLGSKGQKEIFSRNTGTALKQLPIKQLKDIPVPVPTLLEQQKIGNFFKELDSTIALHQRKLAKLKELKQGYLQKLFPKNGSKFPQLRFAGFADAWEQRKLGDLVNVDTGSRNHQDAVQGGRYPFYVRSENIEALDEYDFDETAILVPGDGRIGEIFHFVQGKFALHQRVYKLDGFTGVMPEFLIQLLRHGFRKHALRMNAQGTVPSLRKPVFTEWQVLIPNTKEQKPISYLLRCLDKTIALQQRKLEKLQELKKGYLQKMFC